MTTEDQITEEESKRTKEIQNSQKTIMKVHTYEKLFTFLSLARENPKQPVHCQHRARCGARTHEAMGS